MELKKAMAEVGIAVLLGSGMAAAPTIMASPESVVVEQAEAATTWTADPLVRYDRNNGKYGKSCPFRLSHYGNGNWSATESRTLRGGSICFNTGYVRYGNGPVKMIWWH